MERCAFGHVAEWEDLMGCSLRQAVIYQARDECYSESELDLSIVPEGRCCEQCRDGGPLNRLVERCTGGQPPRSFFR